MDRLTTISANQQMTSPHSWRSTSETWAALGVVGETPGVAEGAGAVVTGQAVVEAGLRRSVTTHTHTHTPARVFKNQLDRV